jgi:hypothetical protein
MFLLLNKKFSHLGRGLEENDHHIIDDAGTDCPLTKNPVLYFTGTIQIGEEFSEERILVLHRRVDDLLRSQLARIFADEALQALPSQFQEISGYILRHDADPVHECVEGALPQDDLPALHHGQEPKTQGKESSASRVAMLIVHLKSLTVPLRGGGVPIANNMRKHAVGLTRTDSQWRRTRDCNLNSSYLPRSSPCG